jgi:hypothetical protein
MLEGALVRWLLVQKGRAGPVSPGRVEGQLPRGDVLVRERGEEWMEVVVVVSASFCCLM